MTTDGRCLVGSLKGYDQTTNLIISNCQERIITPDEPPEIIDLGLYLVRGLSVAVIGEVDEEIAKDIDWSKVSALTTKANFLIKLTRFEELSFYLQNMHISVH